MKLKIKKYISNNYFIIDGLIYNKYTLKQEFNQEIISFLGNVFIQENKEFITDILRDWYLSLNGKDFDTNNYIEVLVKPTQKQVKWVNVYDKYYEAIGLSEEQVQFLEGKCMSLNDFIPFINALGWTIKTTPTDYRNNKAIIGKVTNDLKIIGQNKSKVYKEYIKHFS